MKAIDRVLEARNPNRPKVTDYIDNLFSDFFQQKGDLLGKEDPSIYGGIALFQGRPVTIIGHRKGKNVDENIKYNFGMPGPEGYRKALRIMKQAEKFNRPIITFIDTPGAYPGVEAEAYGISQAISSNLALMSKLEVPIISIITGEGNSGGALGLAVSNRIFMLENSVYSVLSPEGFASILWNDSSKRDDAAEVMKLTAKDLYHLGIIDGIIPERGLYLRVANVIASSLRELDGMSGEELAEERFNKIRNLDEKYLNYKTKTRMEKI